MNNLILLFVFFPLFINCQNLFKDGPVGSIEYGYVNSGSTVLSHFRKNGTTKDLFEYDCQPEYSNHKNNVYTVNQQADLLYYEEYTDSTKKNIITQGYYRLIFKDEDLGYCWVKDLVWNYFDSNGYLIRKEYFDKGNQIKVPTFSQPPPRKN